ncbi:MAG: hypothetical protein COV66_01380 [Nitrospinae bacterium CG11_big_fil_rev_8_21_14_0_20_45_15]|nr:MAG: hypothetical protein COV66_01380 [Nitrospinae bacterium CG11_big_fil_rev_8_21_14_0_20_45_15]
MASSAKNNIVLILIGTAFFFSACSSDAKKEPEMASVRLNPDIINLGMRAKLDLSALPKQLPEISNPEEKKELQSQRKEDKEEEQTDLFKTDPDYLKMDRMEKVDRSTHKKRVPISKFSEGLESNFPILERPLIFSGAGFEIHDFEKLSMQMNEFRYDDHLYILYPHQVLEKHLTTRVFEGAYARSDRYLIFHPTGPVWGDKSLLPIVGGEGEATTKPTPVKLDAIPETELTFMPGLPTLMTLNRKEDALNLITGNEAINKHRYQSEYHQTVN